MNDNTTCKKEPEASTRIAIVTGATSGIGEATVRKLVKSGLNVIGNSRNKEKLYEIEKELGNSFHGIPGDIVDEKVQDALFKSATSYYGYEASILVVNAGRGLGGSVVNADLTRYDEVIHINMISALALMQKAAKTMLGGLDNRPFPLYAADIVVIGSAVGRNVSPFSAVYGSTKFALHSLAEGLRREVGPKGIRVSLVEPGIVESGFQKAAGYSREQVENFHKNYGPLLIGEDIANAIAFIVSQPPHINVSNIVVRPTRQDYP